MTDAHDQRQQALRIARSRIDRVNAWLRLGAALPPTDYPRLRDAGVTHVVDLREESDSDRTHPQSLGIEQRHAPVPDNGPPTIEQLVDITALITERGTDTCLYVHCKGGFGRAATMAAGLLVVQGSGVDDAIEQIRNARPEIQINDAQLDWLREVERAFAATPDDRSAE